MAETTIPRHLLLDGRAYRVIAEYSGPNRIAEADAHLAREPGVSLIVDPTGPAYVTEATGVLVFGANQRPRSLECCCCGNGLKGRQWHNRDDGYGLCPDCIDYCAERETPEGFERNYGLRGIHFDIIGSAS